MRKYSDIQSAVASEIQTLLSNITDTLFMAIT